jgi:hypothetical protein
LGKASSFFAALLFTYFVWLICLTQKPNSEESSDASAFAKTAKELDELFTPIAFAGF